MIVKRIGHKWIPRADEHDALLLNVQADQSSDLTIFGLSKLCKIKQYQSYISTVIPKRK